MDPGDTGLTPVQVQVVGTHVEVASTALETLKAGVVQVRQSVLEL